MSTGLFRLIGARACGLGVTSCREYLIGRFFSRKFEIHDRSLAVSLLIRSRWTAAQALAVNWG